MCGIRPGWLRAMMVELYHMLWITIHRFTGVVDVEMLLRRWVGLQKCVAEEAPRVSTPESLEDSKVNSDLPKPKAEKRQARRSDLAPRQQSDRRASAALL